MIIQVTAPAKVNGVKRSQKADSDSDEESSSEEEEDIRPPPKKTKKGAGK